MTTIFKKLMEKDKEMHARTPKKVRMLNWIFLVIATIFLIFFQVRIITTIFVLMAMFTHPWIFPKIREMYDGVKMLNSEKCDWLELK